MGIYIENTILNKSFCEEIFGGELDVTEKPDGEKCQARQHKDVLKKGYQKEILMIAKIEEIFEKKQNFCQTHEEADR